MLARSGMNEASPVCSPGRRVAARRARAEDRPDQDPRGLGEALRGPELGKYWKYRVGDYRIVRDIRDDRILILVVRIGHRREVYR